MSGRHECPAPSCERVIPSHLFACRAHWFSIPEPLRRELWRAYRREGVLSEAYVDAADACEAFLMENFA